MIITFVGISGSGKSTLAKATAEKLETELDFTCALNSPFFNPGRPLWYKAIWSLYLWRYFNPKLFWRMSLRLYLYRPRFFSRRISTYRTYLPLIFKYHIRRARADENIDVVIFDEDLTLNIGLTKKNPSTSQPNIEEITQEVVHVYKNHILQHTDQVIQVVVDTPIAEAAVRFEGRDGQKADIDRAKRNKEIAIRVAANIDTIVPAVETVVVDGSQEPEKNAEIILDTIHNKLTSNVS